MRDANRRYYEEWVRPQAFARRILGQAFRPSEEGWALDPTPPQSSQLLDPQTVREAYL
jgi:hypothetical protein